MAIELNDDQCDRWPICANCEGGLSSTDYEAGHCTQCGAVTTKERDDDDND